MRKIDPQKQQAKRQMIVEAAMTCFAKQGFHSTSTAQICEQAGMSPGNLFHYFPTKDAIIQAIAGLDRQETSLLLGRLEDTNDVVDGLKEIAGEVLAFSRNPNARALFLEVAAETARNNNVAKLFAENELLTQINLVSALKRGVQKGQVDPALDLQRTAFWLIALLDGICGRVAFENADATKDQATINQMIERFLRPQ